MKRFRRILTGVDLSGGDRLVSQDLTPPNREAVRRSIELAKESGANLCLMSALDVSAGTQKMIEEYQGSEPNVVDAAQGVLQNLVTQASEEGVRAEAVVCFGKSWLTLIQRTISQQHDLVVVGTRNPGPLERMLYGSTAMKLLRYCPCPVWVTKPVAGIGFRNILVAHDLSEVGHDSLRLGASLAALHGAKLLVIHGLELTPSFGIPPAGFSEAEQQIRLEAARQRIMDDVASLHPKPVPDIHVVTGQPEEAILRMIEENAVDVVVMGTRGRSGVSGMLIGNTAERLLPRLTCSVLAVRHADFVCPVSLP